MNRIQELQETYENDGYWGKWGEWEDLQHIHTHLSKVVGELGALLEMHDHDQRGELSQEKQHQMTELYWATRLKLSPDLAIYAAHLANIFNLDLEGQVMRRIAQNKAKKTK